MRINVYVDQLSGRAGFLPEGGDTSLLGPGNWVRQRDAESGGVPREIEDDLRNQGVHVTAQPLVRMG